MTTRRDGTGRTRHVSQVDSNTCQTANELNELKEMMQKMLVEQMNGVKLCEF